jgi:hypothetical protein
VIAAVRNSRPAPLAAGHDEPIAHGAFVIQRPDSWELADATGDTALFVSQGLPNSGVTFIWTAAKDGAEPSPPSYARVEKLPDGKIGDVTAQRYGVKPCR